jgi:hypothetical protein
MIRHSNFGKGQRFCSSPKYLDRFWGPSTFIFNGQRGSLPRRKRLGHDVDHSPPSRSDVKKKWSYTSTPPIGLHGLDRYFTFAILVTRTLHKTQDKVRAKQTYFQFTEIGLDKACIINERKKLVISLLRHFLRNSLLQ